MLASGEDTDMATADQQRRRRKADGARVGRVGRPVTAPHGTLAAYQRHLRSSSPSCERCRRAVASYRARLRTGRRPTVDERRRLLLAVEVLRQLEADPQTVLAKARANLAVMAAADTYHHAAHHLNTWSDLLDEGAGAVALALVDWSEPADELRSTMPFAGVLNEDARRAVLAAARR